MNENTISALRTELGVTQSQLARVVQTQNIVNELKPVPVPAYLTCSPYASSYYAYNGIGGCGGCSGNLI